MASLRLVAADEPHGVVGPAVAVGAQAVDRHDPGVLQSAGDLGLEHEPVRGWSGRRRASSRICFSATSRCSSASSATKTAPRPPRAWGRRTRNRWPSVVARRRRSWPCGRRRRRSVDAAVTRSPAGRGWPSTSGSPEPGQAAPRVGRGGGDGGEALLGATAVLLHVQRDHRLEAGRCSPSRSPRAVRDARPASWPCRESTPGRRRRAEPWSIRPFWSASRPKSRLRSAAAVIARLRSLTVDQPNTPASSDGLRIRSRRPDYRKSDMHLHPCRRVSLEWRERYPVGGSPVPSRARRKQHAPATSNSCPLALPRHETDPGNRELIPFEGVRSELTHI